MIILIRRRNFFTCVLFFLFFSVLSIAILGGDNQPYPVFSPNKEQYRTVIIDAGHGGEDGGAVASSGAKESHMNLAISLRVNGLLRFLGQKTILTRSEDISISDAGLDTIRARKASDLKNRVKIVNQTPDSILLSIHQNSLPSSPVTHGAQVFWNTQNNADILAEYIQNSLNLCINIGNEKQTKPISNTIYLTKHVTAPAVVIECGFLSNAEEAQRLQEPAYQTKVATVIADGYLHFLKGEKDT